MTPKIALIPMTVELGERTWDGIPRTNRLENYIEKCGVLNQDIDLTQIFSYHCVIKLLTICLVIT